MVGFPGCCARAASGHAAAELATPLMKSRRRIVCPRLRTAPTYSAITAGICDWRNGVARHQFEPFMSALPPKADIRCCDRHVRFVPIATCEPLLHNLSCAGPLRAGDGDIGSHVGAHLSVPKKWSKVCSDGSVQF